MLTVSELAKLAGVSTRTLRFYEQKGLIKSSRSSGNYRLYDQANVDRLQQILFFKYFDFGLSEIRQLLNLPEEEQLTLLAGQRNKIIMRQQQLQRILTSLDETLKWRKGEIEMTNEEKFEALKQEKLAENEARYGQEIREKYGEETVAASNQKFQHLTEEQMKRFEEIQVEIGQKLQEYITGGKDSEDLARQIFTLHKEFLQMTWPSYSAEAHRGLGEMYVADPRFRKYYQDAAGNLDAATTLNEIIQKYAK